MESVEDWELESDCLVVVVGLLEVMLLVVGGEGRRSIDLGINSCSSFVLLLMLAGLLLLLLLVLGPLSLFLLLIGGESIGPAEANGFITAPSC